MPKKIEYRFYKLVFPVDFTLEQSLDFFDTVAASLNRGRLGSLPETMVLELWSDKSGLVHRVGLPWEHTELVDQLRGHLPGIYIEEHERESIPDWTHVIELGVNDGTRPFNLPRVHAQVKRILSAAIAERKHDDTLVMQWVVSAADRISPPTPQNPPISSQWSALWHGRRADSQELAERRENASQSQFRGVLRLAASSSTEPHAKKLVTNMKKALKAPETAAVHFTEQWWTRKRMRAERLNKGLPLVAPINFINATELAGFSGWPIGVSSFPGLSMGRTRYLPPNESIARDGRRLGLSYEKRPVALSPVDACRHMYVVGPSGLGKTTLLTNSIQQDIERGYGTVVIESKGDLFRAALNAVPRERLGDVVVLDFTDQEHAVGLNILHGGNINSRVDELTRLFARGDGDIYFRDLMYHGLHLLARFPDLTIVDLVPFVWPQNNPMLKAWRDGLIDRLPKNDILFQYWKSFTSMKDSEQKQRVQPVLNRLWEVTSRPEIKRILGQSESTLDLREVMRDNKLLFIYVPDSLGKDSVSLLTSLLFKELWDAVRDVQKDKPTYLYLDEMQRLAGHVDLGEVLSLARSFKFGLVMAHQHRGQLTRELEAAIANAATKVAFRLEGPDANWMQSLMGKHVQASDFMNLDKYQVIAQVGTNGGSSAPTWFRTLPQFDPHGHAEEAIRYSRQRYSRPATEVDRDILRRRAAPAKSETKRARTFGARPKEVSDE
jgi:hypothetical protein